MSWTRQRLNNLFFIIGVLACVVMLFTFDVSFVELWQHLTKAGYWLVPIIGVWVLIYGINAASWWCVIKGVMSSHAEGSQEGALSPWRIFRLTISGYALNYATPVGGLGGEPYRIMELSRDIDKHQATSSVILYAMMHIFAHFWFWFSSIFLYLILAAFGDLPLNVPISLTLGFIALLFFGASYVFAKGYKNGVVLTVLGWLSKIPGLKGWSQRFKERHNDALHNVDTQIAALFSQDKKAFYSSLLLEYASRWAQSLEVLFMLLLFGVDNGGGIDGIMLTYLHSVLIVALTTFFANLIGFLPMQIGVQEGGFVLSIAALGLSASLGIFVSIICRVREIVWIFIGIMLMKLPEKQSRQ